MERNDQDEITTLQSAKLGYPGALQLDVERYRVHVDHFDISEEQKVVLLQTLWNIMRTFAELGFGVDSVQHYLPALKEISFEVDRNQLEQRENSQEFNRAAFTEGE